MAPLTGDRNTAERSGDILDLKVAASKVYFAGALIARDANGRAVPGATATTLKGVGRCEVYFNNGSGADDAGTVRVRKGIFQFTNSAGDAIARADIGNDCYIVDDFTVAKTSATSTRSVAGKVFDVDANGVWVDLRY